MASGVDDLDDVCTKDGEILGSSVVMGSDKVTCRDTQPFKSDLQRKSENSARSARSDRLVKPVKPLNF